jgi:hypothetical protein
MKMLKKSYALILTIIILMLSLPFASVSAQSVDPDFNYGQKIISQRANSESLLKLYNYFIESWETMGRVDYPLDLTLEDGDYWLVAEMAYADHPEYFWAIHASAPMFYNFDSVGGLEVAKEQFDRIEASTKAELGSEYKVPHYDLPDGQVKVPAAWMIEQCGWKGRRSGGAAVWEKQPLVIVNYTGEAYPEEIIGLEKRIIASVKAKFDVELYPEVDHI